MTARGAAERLANWAYVLARATKVHHPEDRGVFRVYESVGRAAMVGRVRRGAKRGTE